MGLQKAFMTKWLVGKAMWGMGFIWYANYYIKHNGGDWSTKGGWKVHTSKPPTMPDNPSYPNKDPKWERNIPSKYNDQGFSKVAVPLKTSTPILYN